MMFFISEIPDGATYASRRDFLSGELDTILNEVQVLDPRWNLDDLSEPPRKEIASLFEIKDFQESKRSANALCSMSLFKINSGFHRSQKSWQTYLDGVRDWISHFRSNQGRQKLRFYVGDDVWETLHKEKILEATDVDFVRMKDSSQKACTGMLWRNLAFDDYNYPYVYIEDLDNRYGWVSNRFQPVDRICMNLRVLKRRFKPTDANFASALTFIFDEGSFFNSGNEDTLQFFKWESMSIDDPVFIHQLANYCRSNASTLTRSPEALPFRVKDALCRYLSRVDTQIFYRHSENVWTTFRERTPSLDFRYLDERWLFYLSKIVDVKWWIPPEKVFIFDRIFQRYGQQALLLRLYRDLVDSGNYLVIEGQENISFLSRFSEDEDR